MRRLTSALNPVKLPTIDHLKQISIASSRLCTPFISSPAPKGSASGPFLLKQLLLSSLIFHQILINKALFLPLLYTGKNYQVIIKIILLAICVIIHFPAQTLPEFKNVFCFVISSKIHNSFLHIRASQTVAAPKTATHFSKSHCPFP